MIVLTVASELTNTRSFVYGNTQRNSSVNLQKIRRMILKKRRITSHEISTLEFDHSEFITLEHSDFHTTSKNPPSVPDGTKTIWNWRERIVGVRIQETQNIVQRGSYLTRDFLNNRCIHPDPDYRHCEEGDDVVTHYTL